MIVGGLPAEHGRTRSERGPRRCVYCHRRQCERTYCRQVQWVSQASLFSPMRQPRGGCSQDRLTALAQGCVDQSDAQTVQGERHTSSTWISSSCWAVHSGAVASAIGKVARWWLKSDLGAGAEWVCDAELGLISRASRSGRMRGRGKDATRFSTRPASSPPALAPAFAFSRVRAVHLQTPSCIKPNT